MASEDPQQTIKSSFGTLLDNIFLTIYTVELCLKVLAKGLIFNEGAYLRDSFNVLDFVIVGSAYLTIAQSSQTSTGKNGKEGGLSLNSLRAFRVLRPLRSITAIKGLKILVQAVLASLPLLQDTIIVLVFFLLVWAIAGIQMLQGKLKNRCMYIKTGQMAQDADFGFSFGVSDGGIPCGAYQCPMTTFCAKTSSNPDNGTTNYDNILYGFIVTFQNITLEGWSDTMRYFRMTRDMNALIIIFFFCACVFIGAFFLLNLTLAVINTAFGQKMDEFKAAEAKEREEKRKFMKVQSAEEEDDQYAIEPNAAKGPRVEIGLDEFFYAKRAVRKMVDFYKRKKEERKRLEEEEERERQLQELQEEVAETAREQPELMTTLKRLKGAEASEKFHLLSPSSTGPIAAGERTTARQSKKNQVISLDEEFPNSSGDPVIKVKNEEEEELSDDSLDQHLKEVEKFLKEIEQNTPQKDARTARFKDPVFAQKLMGFIGQGEHAYDNLMPRLPLDRRMHDIEERESIAGLEDLDLERFAEEHLQPQNIQTAKTPSDENKQGTTGVHESWDFPRYLSDDGTPINKKEQTDPIESDRLSSAISSDASFMMEVERLKAEAQEQKKAKEERRRNRGRENFKKNHEARKRYKRTRTLDSTKAAINLNKVLGGLNTSIDQSPRPGSALSARSNTSGKDKKSVKFAGVKDERKIISENYQQVDEKFLLWKKPHNPYEYIDKKVKKIDINPGYKYVSSSQHEVLEPRLNQSKNGTVKTISKYIKPVKWLEEQNDQDDYIEPLFDAYQLKTVYGTKQVEHIEFDSDDDDNLILAIQPYDTVQNVGSKHLLHHLPTRTLTSRSDIIVSSTMSITLTPKTAFEPQNTNEMTEKQLTEWVNLRCEYRALNVHQAALIGTDKFNESSLKDTTPNASAMESEYPSQESIVYTEQSAAVKSPGVSQHSRISKQQTMLQKLGDTYKLPSKGLNEPLGPVDYTHLDQVQKKIYDKWKNKYDAQKSMIVKQNHDRQGTSKNYSLEEARKMLEGNYHEDQMDDSKPTRDKVDGHEPKSHFLNREDIKGDLDVLGFEKVIAKLVEDEQLEKQAEFDKKFEERNKKDEVADEIRAEFELPEDIGENRVDFQEIRRSDASRKRKMPTWSGQDVMCVSYNISHAEQVTNEMSTLRVWPKGFAGVLKRGRFVLRKFIMSDLIDNLMTSIVLANTIIMALERYGISEKEAKIHDQITGVFTWIFIFEFASKIIALGPQKYVDNRMNILDGGIVQLSLIELAMGTGGGALMAFRAIRVLRMLRVLRVARFLRSLQSMQQIMSIIARSGSQFVYIFMLLIIFLFIYTLLGMQIFGGRFNFADYYPRGNYDSFTVAFFTAFDTLTMENWNSLLYDSIRSSVWHPIAVIYYISWIFVGNWILLNLFLAILLDSFLEEDENNLTEEEMVAAEKAAEELKKKQVQKEKERRLKKLGGQVPTKKKDRATLAKAMPLGKKPPEELIDDVEDLNEDQLREYLIELQFEKSEVAKVITFADAEIECQKSLYLFSQQNWLRIKLLHLYKAKFFDNFIMSLIVFSSLKLAIDPYQNNMTEGSRTAIIFASVSKWVDLFFTVSFTCEMCIKIISLGFIMDNGSYLRESWNQLDFFIVCTSLLDLMLTGKKIGFIKVIRILRVLRPLRFISHNKGMKMIVTALLDSWGALFNVIGVIAVVFLIFAILAVNLFAGKFFYCNSDVDPYLVHSQTDCIKLGGQWVRWNNNFDNTYQGMISLYVLVSFEGWPNFMYQALDATSVDEGPGFQHSLKYGYFYVIFLMIGSMFFMNFLVGVLFLKYTQAQKEDNKAFTTEQLGWIDIQEMIENAQVDHAYRYKPTRENHIRIKVWRIINSNWFDTTIMSVIVLNMISMACTFDGNPAWWVLILKYANYVFSAIFVVEASLKLFVYRRAYFYTAWNKFDFFVVSASILDITMDLMGGGIKALKVAPQLARVMRVLRVTRVLRLAGKNEGLQALLMTIQMSVGSLINVTMLLMLIYFMFSVLAVFLFQNVTESDPGYDLEQLMPGYRNFNNFQEAFLLLFVLSTGENWPLVMYDTRRSAPNCGPHTCGSKYSTVYFMMFVLVVQRIMLNLFVLVIIEQFEHYYVSDDSPIPKFKKNLEIFEKAWIEDTEKYQHVKIKDKHVSHFIRKLPLPIGIPPDVPEAQFKVQLLKMGIRGEGGFVYFNELLYRCMRRQYGQFKLNRAMTMHELATQFRLLRMRDLDETRTKSEQRKFSQIMGDKAEAFNPFMTLMFFKITFNRWLNMARKEMNKRELQAEVSRMRSEASAQGMTYRSKDTPKFVETQEFVDIEILEEQDELLSDPENEDEDDIPSQLNKSKAIKSESDELKSPDVHIAKSKLLKYSVEKRFKQFGERQQVYAVVDHNKKTETAQPPATKTTEELKLLNKMGLDVRSEGGISLGLQYPDGSLASRLAKSLKAKIMKASGSSSTQKP